MIGKAPAFWWKKAGLKSSLLMPLAWGYNYIATRKLRTANPPRIDVPVICVGNFTLGGTGKTPVVIALAKAAQKAGLKPGIVSRGHGGRIKGPHHVDRDYDYARDVGDEPLLLSQNCDVVISIERFQGAQMLHSMGCNFIIMDDGFQSRRLTWDYALIVAPAQNACGNGKVFPAGPLRADIDCQLTYSDALISIGASSEAQALLQNAFIKAKKPVYVAHIAPHENVGITQKPVLAFAGIGNPQKFYDTLTQMGAVIAETRNFADHHFFSQQEIEELYQYAKQHDLQLVTTRKDYMRLRDSARQSKDNSLIVQQIDVVDIDIVFDTDQAATRIINDTLACFQQRSNQTK